MTGVKSCGRCGDDYESYTFFVRDNLSDMVDMMDVESVYGQVCRECRGEITRKELRNAD